MKFISWNVNGLRAVVKKDFLSQFPGFNADAVCLQETKLSAGQLDLEFEGYTSYWNHAQRKGYSGTAVYTRKPVKNHTTGFPSGRHPEHNTEGRVITLEYDAFYLVNVYAPNSRNELARLPYRMEWEDAFLQYIKELDAVKPVVICGDLNVAHNDIDLKNPATNHNNPGFTDQERSAFQRLLDAGMVDTFRHLHPDRQQFSWWSYRYGARAKGIGWRIDYFLVSARIAHTITEADILDTITGSDHCPVTLTLALE